MSLFTALRGSPPSRSRPSGGASNGSLDLQEWRRYCAEVAAAADLLASTARRAEGAAGSAALYGSEAMQRVRQFELGSLLPDHDAQFTTYATALVGCFAALERLGRCLVVHE